MGVAGRKNTTFTIPLLCSEPHPCPYLAGRVAEDEFTITHEVDAAIYEDLMNQGFRRSGCILYRPVCESCGECRPLRVSVAAFRPTRSQRRVVRKNRDVMMHFDNPVCSDEKWRMYREYLAYQHDGTMSDDRDDFERFLYESPTDTREMTYCIGDRPVGIGIVDVGPNCLSSVYFFFNPAEARRSLGIYSSLVEIELCRELGLSYWYAGYFVRDCRRMKYKAQFRPYELLDRNGRWHAT